MDTRKPVSKAQVTVSGGLKWFSFSRDKIYKFLILSILFRSSYHYEIYHRNKRNIIDSLYLFQKIFYHDNHMTHSAELLKWKSFVLSRKRVFQIFSNFYITCYRYFLTFAASIFSYRQNFLKVELYTQPTDLSCHRRNGKIRAKAEI